MSFCNTLGCSNPPKFKGICKKCYFKAYENSPKRVAYKKAYNASEPRKEYSRKRSKTPSAKKSRDKFQKTEAFRLIQEKYRMSEKSRFSMGRSQAIKRGVAWDITFEQYQQIIQPICHYCSGSLSPFGINLDRKDNAIHYTATNVTTCCGGCNRTKGDRLTYDEMVAISNLLKEMRSSK